MEIILTQEETQESNKILKEQGEEAYKKYMDDLQAQKMKEQDELRCVQDELNPIPLKTAQPSNASGGGKPPSTFAQLKGIGDEDELRPQKPTKPTKTQEPIQKSKKQVIKLEDYKEESVEPLTREEVQQILSHYSTSKNNMMMGVLISAVAAIVVCFLFVQMMVMPQMVSKVDFTKNLTNIANDIKVLKETTAHLEQVDRNVTTQINAIAQDIAKLKSAAGVK